MDLEFNCPYCTAAIRVGVESAGKVGRCPKCETRLRIPEIPATGEAAQPPLMAPMQTIKDEILEPLNLGTSHVVQPGIAQTPLAGPGGWTPNVDPNSYQEQRKKKRRQGSPYLALIPPLLFGVLFVAIGAGYWYWSQPSYKGTLEGTVIESHYALTVTLDGPANGAPREEFASWMQRLFQTPVTLVDNQRLLGVRYLSRDGRQLTVLLEPGADTELVQVPITSLTTIAKFYNDHSIQLDDDRQAELTAALVQVCQDWAAVKESDGSLENLNIYTTQLAYNAHVRGLGRVCEASVGGKLYPCVGENAQQQLVFLVPKGTLYFVIQERPELRVFPSRLNVEVTVLRPADPAASQPVVPSVEPTTPMTEPEVLPDSTTAPEMPMPTSTVPE